LANFLCRKLYLGQIFNLAKMRSCVPEHVCTFSTWKSLTVSNESRRVAANVFALQ